MWSLAGLYIGIIIVPCICQRFKMFNQIPWAYNICQWHKFFLSLFWLRSVARNWSMLMIGSVSKRFPWTHEAQILHFSIRNEQVIIHHWNSPLSNHRWKCFLEVVYWSNSKRNVKKHNDTIQSLVFNRKNYLTEKIC